MSQVRIEEEPLREIIRDAIAKAVAAEREACATLVEQLPYRWFGEQPVVLVCKELAGKIRSRK